MRRSTGLRYGAQMRFIEVLRRGLTGGLCLFALHLAAAAPAADPPPRIAAADAAAQELAGAELAFERAAPLPAWAELLPLPAPQAERRPAVVRLWETQLHVGTVPTRLTNRVVQVNHASALDEIGQLALEFNPQFERLLLHRLLIHRGPQAIDHTRTASVRLLQREAKLEQGLYSGLITASIVLPRVRVGDTLQVVYSIVGENPVLHSRYSHRALWDQSHAVAWRRVTLVAPVQRQVHWRWLGGVDAIGPSPSETVAAGMRRLRFETHNLAAVGAEPAMPADAQALRQLQFSEYADWNEVARWASALFPLAAPLPDEMAPLMARLGALADAEERASQALHWVQTEVRHWSLAVGEWGVRPQTPAVVMTRGWGDCKDKAVLLTRMLLDLGVEARPALASAATRRGPASMLPAPDLFDHVIVQARLAGRDFFLDPTRHGQTGLLSRIGQHFEEAAVLPVDVATQALVIVRSPNRADIFRSRLYEHVSLAQLDADGRLDVELQWFGLQAENVRVSLLHMDAAQLRSYVATAYQQQYTGSRLIGEPEVNDERRLNEMTIRARFVLPAPLRAIGDRWAIDFAPNLGDVIELPLQPLRRFPLVVPSFPVTYRYQIDMAWPEGLAIDATPTSQPMETPHFRALTTRSVKGNTETRTIEFAAKVGAVPADEVRRFAIDVATLQRRLGGVMLASAGSAPLTAVEVQREADDATTRR